MLISYLIVVNGGLAQGYGIYSSAVIVHFIGLALSVIIYVFAKKIDKPKKKLPFYCYIGGALGVGTIVFSSIAFGKISISAILAIGLFAAGITSAITAPLATAYVMKGIFGWKKSLKSKRFRAVWMFILLLGVLFSSLHIKPIEIIKFAQIANGILLPVISGFLLWIMNKKEVLGKYSNNLTQNILGFIILGVTVFLGLKSIWKVISSF